MAFKLPGVGDEACLVCGSHYRVAANVNWCPRYPLCERHSHCQQHVVGIIVYCQKSGKKIPKEQWDALRLNSHDRDALIPYMSDEVLIESVEFNLKNCVRFDPPAGTYDEALQLYAVELVKRLKLKEEK